MQRNRYVRIDDVPLRAIRFGERARGARTGDILLDWRRFFQVPWLAVLDLAIGLLYIFFVISFQRTKSHFTLNVRDLLDEAILPEQDLFVFKTEMVEALCTTVQRFFEVINEIPIQGNLTLQGVDAHCMLSNGTEITIAFTERPMAELFQIAVIESVELVGELDWSVEGGMLSVRYSVIFERVEPTRAFTVSSALVGSAAEDNPLAAWHFGAAIAALDALGLFASFWALGVEIWRAAAFARPNYLSVWQALRDRLRVRVLLVLGYQVVTLVACILMVWYGDSLFGVAGWIHFVMAGAGFLHFCGIFAHLKMKTEFWFVARLITRSLGRMLAFISGFAPFFLAWLMLGVALFGHFSYLFDGFLRSAKVMFSMMHTDVCMDTQEALRAESVMPVWVVWGWAASWLMQTGGMVLNTMISIAEHVLEDLLRQERQR